MFIFYVFVLLFFYLDGLGLGLGLELAFGCVLRGGRWFVKNAAGGIFFPFFILLCRRSIVYSIFYNLLKFLSCLTFDTLRHGHIHDIHTCTYMRHKLHFTFSRLHLLEKP